MTIKTILTEPNKILRQISQPVVKVTKDDQKLMDDMLETMYHANGIGLAAIQIGVPKRIIVIDISKDKNAKKPMFFVNPVIKKKNTEFSTYEEGCLSVPAQFAVKPLERCKDASHLYSYFSLLKVIRAVTGFRRYLLLTWASWCSTYEIKHCPIFRFLPVTFIFIFASIFVNKFL